MRTCTCTRMHARIRVRTYTRRASAREEFPNDFQLCKLFTRDFKDLEVSRGLKPPDFRAIAHARTREGNFKDFENLDQLARSSQMEFPMRISTPGQDAHTHIATQLLRDAAEFGVRFGSGTKVYLGTVPGVDLADAECVAMLDELRVRGLVQFSRCDLTAAADADLLEQSWWQHESGADFHFLCVA